MGQGGPGAPPQYGQPGVPPQYGQPGPGGFGGPGAGAGFGAGMVPAGPQGMSGPTGPVGTVRNPVMVFVISYLCFIYALIQIWGMVNELKSFRQKDDLNPIMFFIPILNLIEIWRLPEKVLDAKRMAGVHNPTVPSPILYLFLGLYFIPADLNEVWQAASGGAR